MIVLDGDKKYRKSSTIMTPQDTIRISNIKLPLPADEAERLVMLRQSQLLDSDTSDASFDRFSSLAQRIFKVPIALVALVDVDRIWFKSNVGLESIKEIKRSEFFCQYSVLPDQADTFVVEDTILDSRFKSFPLVTGDPKIRFYAGTPLILDGMKVGTLCILDTKPRNSEMFNGIDRMNLLDLGEAVSMLVKDRRDVVKSAAKECAKVMVDLMQDLRRPLSSLNIATHKVLEDLQLLEELRSTQPISDSQEVKENSLSASVLIQNATGHLKVLLDSGMCLGNFLHEKCKSNYLDGDRWPSFTVCNVHKSIRDARQVLLRMSGDSSTSVVWKVDTESFEGTKRHISSPKVIHFTFLHVIEFLIYKWRSIEVHVKCCENSSVAHDSVMEAMEKLPLKEVRRY